MLVGRRCPAGPDGFIIFSTASLLVSLPCALVTTQFEDEAPSYRPMPAVAAFLIKVICRPAADSTPLIPSFL